jgi:hypothetical protein
MPRKTKINKRRRKSRNFKNKKNRVLVPNQKLEILRVCESDNYQLVSGDYFTYYVGNGLFNPGGTNWNAQPAGFDQWTAFYSKYRVIGSKINILAVNNSDSTVNGIWLVCYPSVVNTELTGGLASAMSQPYARKTFMANINGNNKCTLTNRVQMSKVFGESPYRDENFSGDFGSNPAFKMYWCINLFGIGSDQANVEVIITISFIVKFYARIPLSLSSPMDLTSDVNSSYMLPHLRVKAITLPVVINQFDENKN